MKQHHRLRWYYEVYPFPITHLPKFPFSVGPQVRVQVLEEVQASILTRSAASRMVDAADTPRNAQPQLAGDSRPAIRRSLV